MQLVSKKKPWVEVEIRFWSQGSPFFMHELLRIEPKIPSVTNKQWQTTMAAALNASGFQIPPDIGCFLLESNSDCSGWCGYMKGGLPERVPALPILMLISSSSCCREGSSAFSFICLASWGRAKAKWGSAATPCRWQKGCNRLESREKKKKQI